MKIAVDARMIKMSGIGTYIQNLMKNDCYDIAIGNKEDIKEFKKLDNNNIIEFNEGIYGIKEQLKFPYKKLKKLKPDVLHVPHYNVPIFYSGKMIVTIHDLTHLKYRKFLPNKFAYIYAKVMLWIATKKAYKIITVSENTKKDIIEIFKVNPNKIEVIYNGVGAEFNKEPKEKYSYLYEKYKIPTNKKTLMYVGNLKAHKNLGRLLEAFKILNTEKKFTLILVGKAFKNYDILKEAEKRLGVENAVIHTGTVSNMELIDFYNLSDLFVFPSLYEGFGLPILEALACGTRVACSNTSSMPEVGGKYVTYFNPTDVNEISQKLEIGLNSTFDYEMVKEWTNHFDWNDVSNKTKKVFKQG